MTMTTSRSNTSKSVCISAYLGRVDDGSDNVRFHRGCRHSRWCWDWRESGITSRHKHRRLSTTDITNHCTYQSAAFNQLHPTIKTGTVLNVVLILVTLWLLETLCFKPLYQNCTQVEEMSDGINNCWTGMEESSKRKLSERHIGQFHQLTKTYTILLHSLSS